MSRRSTLLIIDDVPSEVVLLGETLRPLGEVLTATNGTDGLEIAARTLPDLVILDVGMPGLSGFDVIRSLKANPRLAAIPVIFLTVQTEEGDEFTGLNLGAVDYLGKPTPPALVSARVRNHLRLKELYEQQAALVEELRSALDFRNHPRPPFRQCAWCRRVRTPSGAWEPLDLFLSKVPKAPFLAFTVCSDCLKEVLREPSPSTPFGT